MTCYVGKLLCYARRNARSPTGCARLRSSNALKTSIIGDHLGYPAAPANDGTSTVRRFRYVTPQRHEYRRNSRPRSKAARKISLERIYDPGLSSVAECHDVKVHSDFWHQDCLGDTQRSATVQAGFDHSNRLYDDTKTCVTFPMYFDTRNAISTTDCAPRNRGA